MTRRSSIRRPAHCSEGTPCRLTIVVFGQQFLRAAQRRGAVRDQGPGRRRRDADLPALSPPTRHSLLQEGKDLPGKRILAEPNVLTVDWAAALQEAGIAGVVA